MTGQRAGDDFGKARGGERDRFAGQPFERAMRAHMHERVEASRRVAAKARRPAAHGAAARRVVIVGAPFGCAAAIRRQRDNNIAEPSGAEAEDAVAQIGIVRGLAPGFVQPRRGAGGRQDSNVS